MKKLLAYIVMAILFGVSGALIYKAGLQTGMAWTGIENTMSRDYLETKYINASEGGYFGSGEFSSNVNMTGNYILYFPLESWIHTSFSLGVTDVSIVSIEAGVHNQNRHYAKVHVSLDRAPGAGKTVSVSISDGTSTMIVEISGTNTSGTTTTSAFDLDSSTEDLTFSYSQGAGGASTEACIMFHWWYIENG